MREGEIGFFEERVDHLSTPEDIDGPSYLRMARHDGDKWCAGPSANMQDISEYRAQCRVEAQREICDLIRRVRSSYKSKTEVIVFVLLDQILDEIEEPRAEGGDG